MHRGSKMTRPLNFAMVVSHPSEDSFTLAVARRFLESVEAYGQAGFVRDLYRLGFDPLLKESERHGEVAADVEAELALLDGADVIVLVYPIWFGAPPAMLKGYVDRVFGAGRAVGQVQDGGATGRLAGKQLVSLQLSGSMRAWLHEKGVMMSLRTLFERYLSEVFGLPVCLDRFQEPPRHGEREAVLRRMTDDQGEVERAGHLASLMHRTAGGSLSGVNRTPSSRLPAASSRPAT